MRATKRKLCISLVAAVTLYCCRRDVAAPRKHSVRVETTTTAPPMPLAPLFVNPDKQAAWPRERLWAQEPSDGSNLDAFCTGQRQSRDVIVFLGQKKHSSYDATHANTLNASMASLRTHMKHVAEADVIVWHEGDLTHEDADALDGAANVRFCLLRKETGWGRPPWLKTMPSSEFSDGYRYMIRFYAVTIWPTLNRLGYEWVMRMDDDSFFLSEVSYNIFEDMRHRDALYAYRGLSRECPWVFGDFVEDFVDYIGMPQADEAPPREAWQGCRNGNCGPPRPNVSRRQARVGYRPWYCSVTGKLGFYNNWFVTKISWWLDEPRVAQFIGAFDRSNLIFTVRSNDLIFQTAAIKLFMPKSKRRRYSDFSYQHHTIRNGSVLYGGVEAGWRDDGAQALLAAYASKTTGTHRARDPNVTDKVAFRTWTTGDLVVRRCAVQEELDGPFRETLYVSPVLDATRAHGQPSPRYAAPFCGGSGAPYRVGLE